MLVLPSNHDSNISIYMIPDNGGVVFARAVALLYNYEREELALLAIQGRNGGKHKRCVLQADPKCPREDIS